MESRPASAFRAMQGPSLFAAAPADGSGAKDSLPFKNTPRQGDKHKLNNLFQ